METDDGNQPGTSSPFLSFSWPCHAYKLCPIFSRCACRASIIVCRSIGTSDRLREYPGITQIDDPETNALVTLLIAMRRDPE